MERGKDEYIWLKRMENERLFLFLGDRSITFFNNSHFLFL